MIRFAALSVLVLLSGRAVAAPTECTTMPDFGTTNLAIARVLPNAGRVQFRNTPTCGDKAPGCLRRGYVVPGNELISVVRAGSRLCAVFVAPSGAEYWGWLPVTALAVTTPGVNLADWAGRWMRPEASIAIVTTRGGALSIKGDATFGASDPDRVRRGAVNMGEIAAVVIPKNNALDFAMQDDGGTGKTVPWSLAGEYDCAVRMQRIGRWLAVDDNNRCGGLNVTFRGIYRRAR
jgi:hypothetical protein